MEANRAQLQSLPAVIGRDDTLSRSNPVLITRASDPRPRRFRDAVAFFGTLRIAADNPVHHDADEFAAGLIYDGVPKVGQAPLRPRPQAVLKKRIIAPSIAYQPFGSLIL